MKPLLIEIGCEELPAGASARLAEAFAERIKARLLEAGVAIEPRVGVTPRRLLVHARCPERTPPRERIVWGPPVRVAFDEGGNPTPAAQGFARKVGVALDALKQRLRPPKNEAYLAAVQQEPGRSVAELLAGALPELLRALPMPKRMRWAQGKAREDAFLRPIRWIVARLGKERIPFAYAGVESGFVSFGHRVHGAQGEMDPEDPFGWLEAQYVIADRETRMARIREQIQQLARAEGLSVVEDAELLEEVADLTEWPKALLCRFDAEFLRLPEAVIRTTLKHHQRCFALRKPDGGLAPAFIAVANLEPPEPRLVAKGNERVVRARLSDAAFYFDRDPEIPLPRRVPMLEGIVFQAGLGTMRDLAERLSFGARWLAEQVAADAELAARAALLAKADLTTGLVGEFPELQGTIGGVYAEMAGEPEAVAEAIREHYLPEGGDDPLPRSLLARLIGVIERADKLVGYFEAGLAPTATRDPYALRRAAIGLVRLLSAEDEPIPVPLEAILNQVAEGWERLPPHLAIRKETVEAVRAFVHERIEGMAEALGASRAAWRAALAAACTRPLVQQRRLAAALDALRGTERGQAIAAANKRVANILRQAGVEPDLAAGVDPELFRAEAEQALWQALRDLEDHWPEAPEAALEALATMREPIDRFFDEVLVLDPDPAVRANRLALLARLRARFLQVADVSLLAERRGLNADS